MNRAAIGRYLRTRTKKFALRVIRSCGALPNSLAGQVLGRQLLKCGTSVGAQYREGTRARSDAEFISKPESALQELDETAYWLELLAEADVITARRLKELQTEAEELTAILVASVRTVKNRRRKKWIHRSSFIVPRYSLDGVPHAR